MKPPEGVIPLAVALFLINIFLEQVECVVYRDYSRVSRGYLKPIRMRKRGVGPLVLIDGEQGPHTDREEPSPLAVQLDKLEDMYDVKKRSTLAWANFQLMRNQKKNAELKADMKILHQMLLRMKDMRHRLKYCTNCFEAGEKVSREDEYEE